MTVRNNDEQWPKAKFCEVFGISEAQLERLCNKGVIPHEKNGRNVMIPMPAGRVKYHEYLVAKGKRAATPNTMDDARLRKETAQAALEELKLAREQAITMRVEEHEKLLAEAFGRVRAKLLNLPPRAAGASFGALSIQEAQAKIEPVVTEIMEELFAGEDVPDASNDDEVSDDSADAAD